MRRRSCKAVGARGVLLATLSAAAVATPVTAASARVEVTRPVATTGHHGSTVAGPGTAGIVPPGNPSESLPPSPNFTGDGSCTSAALDDSGTCNADALRAVGNARSTLESLAPVSLNLSAYDAMTVPEQLFVIANLERTDRGLAPIAGLTTQLDNVAQSGAAGNTDPSLSSSTLTGGASVNSWASLWAGGTSNPIGSDYYWMYDDGTGSPNGSCTTPSAPACWGHRDAILGTFTNASCGQAEQYMGTGDTTTGSSYGPSFAEIFVGACGPTPTDVVFTWAQAEQALGQGSGPSAPGPPRNVTAGSSPRRGVVVSWQAPADNGGATITGYKIFRSRVTGAEKPDTTVACAATTCTFTDRHTRAKRMFFYTVAAVNAAGTGPVSSEVSAVAR